MIIVFEGIDGCGKGTQSKRLSEYFTAKNIANSLYSFPNYNGTSFGREIGKYLNGGYGSLSALPPQFPAMLYAIDRFEMKKNIVADLDAGKVIIFDRYVQSNFAHQAAKLDELEQAPFIDWVKRFEYNILGMPEPDVIFFLDVEPSVASKMVLKKEKRTYTDEKKDIHEKDNSYLEKVYNLYKKIAESERWEIIKSTSDGKMVDENLIFEEIVARLRKYKAE